MLKTPIKTPIKHPLNNITFKQFILITLTDHPLKILYNVILIDSNEIELRPMETFAEFVPCMLIKPWLLIFPYLIFLRKKAN